MACTVFSQLDALPCHRTLKHLILKPETGQYGGAIRADLDTCADIAGFSCLFDQFNGKSTPGRSNGHGQPGNSAAKHRDLRISDHFGQKKGAREVPGALIYLFCAASVVAMYFFPALMALLRLEAHGCNRAGVQPLERNRFAGFIAIAIFALIDPAQRRVDL